jgi:hypothetical protein
MRNYLFFVSDVAELFTVPKVVWRDLLGNQAMMRRLRGGGFGCGKMNAIDDWEDSRAKERTHLFPR